MRSAATTIEGYLDALPEDRREALSAVRDVILRNLDSDYEEGMQYGMIGYYVPHSVYPPGYHCDPRQPLPFASIASQKNYMSLYLMCIYGDEAERARFEKAWAKSGCKLDMGKSCIRFKRLEDLPLDVIGEAIRRIPAKKFVAHYESVIKSPKGRGKGTTNRSHGPGAKGKSGGSSAKAVKAGSASRKSVEVSTGKTSPKKTTAKKKAATGKSGAASGASKKPSGGRGSAAVKKAGKRPSR